MPELSKHELCTGCTACAAVCPKGCITMAADADGFFYPKVDEAACIGCGLCEKTCPVLQKNTPAHVPAAFAARSLDTGMRLESSSGGVFSELARVILARGGAVCGAAYDDRFRVVHIFAEAEADLARLRGAKYAQSDLSGVFPAVKARLNAGQQVLFAGTPCQVAGLKAYLGREYEDLLTVDFICHGVPAPAALEGFLSLQAEGKTLRSLDLRAKDTGWSRYRYCHRLEFTDGTSRLIPNSGSLFMQLFVGDHINRLSCAACAFKGYARVSDLTLGDFWGIWELHPELDDDQGTSAVLIQSEQGRRLWDAIAPKLLCREVPLEEINRHNGSLLASSPASARRAEVLSRIRSGDMAGCAELLRAPAPTRAQRAKQKAKGIIRRILGR